MALDPSSLKVEENLLYVPPLQDVAKELQEGLTSYFHEVSVSVVDCPDLTTPPFSLAAPGLCGSTRVVEVGAVPHFMPLPDLSKVYDLSYFGQLLGLDPVLLVGTGAGPFIRGHQCMELITNTFISGEDVCSLNSVARSDDCEKGHTLESLPPGETKFCLMTNLFASNGAQGKVLEIKCKKRISEDDFPAAVRKCLADRFKGQTIGLGGVFIVDGSKTRNHIPPLEFSAEPILTQEQFNNWLHFYDMDPPLTFVGTIITDDLNMGKILQHFHGFSAHGEGGHYHYDVSPHSVEYLAYFSLAERAVHVDRPAHTSSLKVDNLMPPLPE